MSSHRGARKKTRSEESSSGEEEEDERVLFYIPSADINIEVLVFYLKLFLGHDSDAEPGTHPRNREKDGYFIRSRFGLTAAMVADLKKDTIEWKREKKETRSRENYRNSNTAERRREAGASAQPSVPHKTQEKMDAERRREAGASAQPTVPHKTQEKMDAERRAGSFPPVGPPSPEGMGLQRSGTRHARDGSSLSTSTSSTPWNHQGPFQRHQSPFDRHRLYGMTATSISGGGTPRPIPAYNLNVNVNTASYMAAHNDPSRHQSASGQSLNLMPSIEGQGRYHNTPAPPYEEEEENDEKPQQPSTTGTHGFSSTYSTAGSRHGRY